MAVNVIQTAMRTDASGKPVRNVLLLSIPEEEFRVLRPVLEPVDLPRYLILNDVGQGIDYVYFLNEGMTSLVVVTHEGQSVEVGIVGREGLVGASVIEGVKRGAFRAIMQIGGSGLRIRVEHFED